MGRSKYFIFALLIWISGVSVSYGQQVCISQESANKCAELALNEKIMKEQVSILQTQLAERDKIIDELKIRVAVESQKAVDSQAETLRLTAVLEGLLKAYTKPKKWGIIVF